MSFRNWIAREKYKRVYYSSDPMDWLVEADKNKNLMSGKEVPFNCMQDVILKARCILGTRIQPTN